MAARSTFPLMTLLAVALPAAASAQQFTLDLPSIMRGTETVGREPAGIQWSPDSKWIYFSWLPAGSDWRANLEPYRVRAQAGAVPERITRAQADSMAPLLANGQETRDGTRKALALRGDLFLVTLPAGQVRQLTKTAQAEQLLGWSADEKRLFYRVGDNAFALRLDDGFVEQLTDFRAGPAPADSSRRQPPQRAALERDQRDLLQVIRDRAMADSLARRDRLAREAQGLKAVYLNRDEQLRGQWLSPTGAYLLFSTTSAGATKATVVPNYVTASGYVEDIPGRTKVGDALARQRMGLLEIATGKVTWLKPLASDSSGMYGSLGSWGWNDDGSAAIVTATTKDYTTRVVSRLDPATGALAPLETMRDSAWVGGACGGCGGWLPGTRGLWFASEADGYAHIYTMAADGSNRKQLTSGKWEVTSASLDDRRTRFELQTSEGSAYESHFWTMGLDGANKVRYTARPGGHQVTVSPDGLLLADVSSTSNQPPELFVQAAKPMATASRLTTSPTAAWSSYKWLDPDIVEIPASDGAKVPARIYRPEQMGAKSNGAAVIFVHGAGYLHNVTKYWSTYFREYQFNQLLASKGYTVLDLDYRGSAGYGRDWRTAIYRHMGGRDLEDQVDASKWLTATYGIGPDHIGLYGGSYGGFITLMALFTKGDYFGAGAALRSVTDWAHYNHGYTSQILNDPQDDSTAYRRSSPIFFADGLKDPLLMAHGMIDTNVQFEDIIRLSQRLIELGKTRWELAVYPVEDHGFVRPDSWTDEYRRIMELFDRWLPVTAKPER